MLQKTAGIVLRSVKFGDTSLITTVFTSVYGVQAYIIKGVRNPKSKQSRVGLLQPCTLLDLVIYHNPQKNLQIINEFQATYLYQTIHEDIRKNSIALFSIELLLRLLPENAPATTLFKFSSDYLISLDNTKSADTGNYPLFFIINCSRILGYELHGQYSKETPYLDINEGCFSSIISTGSLQINEDDGRYLESILRIKDLELIKTISMTGEIRYRLIEWYILFLHLHTQHMDNINSLPVLKAILH